MYEQATSVYLYVWFAFVGKWLALAVFPLAGIRLRIGALRSTVNLVFAEKNSQSSVENLNNFNEQIASA